MLIGLDVGTSGCKAVIYSAEGKGLDSAYIEYPPMCSLYEIDASIVIEAVKDVLRSIAPSAVKYDAKAICVTSIGETFILVDAQGRPVMPSMLYSDPRGKDVLGELVAAAGESYIRENFGINPHVMYSASKLYWISKNAPAMLDKAKYLMQYSEYVQYVLGGERYVDYSLASRTMMYNVYTHKWDDKMFGVLNIAPDMMSKPVPSGTVTGRILPSIAQELGLPSGLQIVSGGQDQIFAAIGAGVYKPGQNVLGMGSVECVTPVYTRADISRRMTDNNFAAVPFVHPDTYVTYAYGYCGGTLLRWFKSAFKRELDFAARDNCLNLYAVLDKNIPAEPTGLFFLPQLSGSATPDMNVDFKGSLLGITLDTTDKDVYKAAMEGVSYETAYNIETLEASGIKVGQLNAAGGGSRSDTWLQIKADVLGRPLRAVSEAEAGTSGCAMLAGVACGVYHDLDEAAGYFVKYRKTFEPDAERSKRYAALYEKYKAARTAVKALYK